MSGYYDFLKECGVFYMLTVNGNAPADEHFCIFKIQIHEAYIVTDAGRESLV